MGNKRLAINLVANVISYSTTVLITFFLTPYLIRTLGKEAYSFYPLANNFVNYMSILTIALNSMASRFISIEMIKGNKIKANTYFVSVLYSNIILSVLLFIPMSLIVIYLERLLNISGDLVTTVKLLFVFIFVSMIVNIITSVFGVAVFVKNRLDLRSLVEIIQGILRVLLYVLLFTFFKPSIVYVGIVSLLLSICYLLFQFLFTRKLLPEMKFSLHLFDLQAVKEILSSGVWNSVNQLGAVLLSSLSLLICNIYLGADAAGDFSIIMTVPNFVIGIISMISSVFMPILTQMYAKGDVILLVKEVHLSQRIMGIITSVPIAIFMTIGFEFFTLWVPGENYLKLQILSVMTIAPMIITGAVWPVSNLAMIMNKVKIPSLFTICCGIVNIVVVLILLNTTKLGIYAITLAALIVNIVRVGIFIPIYPCKKLNIKNSTFYPIIFKTLSSTMVNFIIFSSLKIMFKLDNWMNLIFFCVICGIIGLVVSFIIVIEIRVIKNASSIFNHFFIK